MRGEREEVAIVGALPDARGLGGRSDRALQIALGLPLDSRIRTVAAKTTLPALSDGFQSWQQTVTEVVALIDAALVTVRAAVTGLDDIDLSSQDVAIEIERGLTKDRWLLQAHVAA